MSDAAGDRAKAATLPEGDVIRILLEQHADIRDLFTQVKSTTGAPKEDAFDQLRSLLAVHETAEQMVLRPVTKQAAGPAMADERNDEEAEANHLLEMLEKMDVHSPDFDTALATFEKAVDDHAESEEKGEFPAVLTSCSRDERQMLGTKIKAAESVAPTHPHPGVEPGSTKQKVVGPFAAIVDRVKDAIAKADARAD